MNSSNSSDVISSIGLSKFTMKSENCRRPLDHWQSTALYLHNSYQVKKCVLAYFYSTTSF